MNQSEKQVPVDPHMLGAMAIGFATGLVVSDRLSRSSREVVAVACLAIGLVATAPFVAKYVTRRINAPTHRFGSRKTLAGIRHGALPTQAEDFYLETSEEDPSVAL